VTLDPLLQTSGVIQAHVAAALFALVLGVVMLAHSKGTPSHKTLGRVWVALMLTVAVTSFWIHSQSAFWGFSWIHGLSIFTIVALAVAVQRIRRGDVLGHRIAMVTTFFGALIVTGAFTLLPGRIMGRVFFGG
jgi:uncharacterized membrane protein